MIQMIWSVILGNFWNNWTCGGLLSRSRLFGFTTREKESDDEDQSGRRTCAQNSISISADSVEHSFSSSLITALINADQCSWNGNTITVLKRSAIAALIRAPMITPINFNKTQTGFQKRVENSDSDFLSTIALGTTSSVWRQRLTGCQRMALLIPLQNQKNSNSKIVCEFNRTLKLSKKTENQNDTIYSLGSNAIFLQSTDKPFFDCHRPSRSCRSDTRSAIN